MRVFLPYPPSANRRLTRAAGRKGFVNTAVYRSWKDEAAWVVAMTVRDSYAVLGPYSLGMVAYPPDRRGRDLDNIIKATSDALKDGGAIKDDKLCQRLSIEWRELDEPGIFCEVLPCHLLISPEAGKSSSTSGKAKPPTRLRSRRGAIIQDAQTGEVLATGNLAGLGSGSRPSSISAASTGPKRRTRRLKGALTTQDDDA